MKEVKKVYLSEHFTLAEMTKTTVKKENVPNEAQVENLKRLCSWLEMLRSEWNSRYGRATTSQAVQLTCDAWASNRPCAIALSCSTSVTMPRRTSMSC